MKRIQLIFWCVLIGYAGFAQDAQLDAAKKKIVANDFAGAKADLTKVIDANPKNKLPNKYGDPSKPALKATVKEGENNLEPFKLTP